MFYLVSKASAKSSNFYKSLNLGRNIWTGEE